MEREVLNLRRDIIDAVLEELADDITRHGIVIDNHHCARASDESMISGKVVEALSLPCAGNGKKGGYVTRPPMSHTWNKA